MKTVPPAHDHVDSDDEGKAESDSGKETVEVKVSLIPGLASEGEDTATPDQGEQEPAAQLDHESSQVHAPFGYKNDGTPRKGNQGRRSPAASDESDKQRARLRSVTPNKSKVQKPGPISSPALAVVNYQAMGEQVAQLWISGGIMAFGADWAPNEAAGEHLAVSGAFRDYFKATNMKDLPPGFALCFVLGTYTISKLSKPDSSVATRFQRIGLWFKEKAGTFKRRKIYAAEV